MIFKKIATGLFSLFFASMIASATMSNVVFEGRFEIGYVQQALASDVTTEAKGPCGVVDQELPLITAIAEENRALIDCLLNNNYDVNEKSNDGITAFSSSVYFLDLQRIERIYKKTVLTKEMKNGAIENIIYRLISRLNEYNEEDAVPLYSFDEFKEKVLEIVNIMKFLKKNKIEGEWKDEMSFASHISINLCRIDNRNKIEKAYSTYEVINLLFEITESEEQDKINGKHMLSMYILSDLGLLYDKSCLKHVIIKSKLLNSDWK